MARAPPEIAVGFDVVVVGSVNQDLTVFTSRHPRPGETILGREHRSGGGGKGANQAVAAARLGAMTALIGRVGDDEPGRTLRASLHEEGIDVTCVGTDGEAPTGLAVITVDDEAENSIVVSPGANSKLRPGHVSECEEMLSGAKSVLSQLEIPLETVAAVATATTGLFCLNPAPARALPDELLNQVDVLTPNRSELSTLVSADIPERIEEAVEMARAIEGPGAVVVTLGSEGALVVQGENVTQVPSPSVEAVDTTGAGDAFCGALGEALSQGIDLVDAVRWATRAGALATTRHGAQTAMPIRDEVESST